MVKKTKNLEKFILKTPPELDAYAEFAVNSRSQDPHLGGLIEVRVEPERVGLRWSGQSLWTWLEWHEALWLANNEPNECVREKMEDLMQRAYQEGLDAAIKEVAKDVPPDPKKGLVYFPEKSEKK